MKFLLFLAAPACLPNPAADGAKADSGQTDDDADGYTLAEGDCDDANDSVNPGAVEVCGDGVDNDCDESPGACGPTSASVSTALQYSGGDTEDCAGSAVSGAGDVNADGYDDFVVGAPGHDSNSGAAYLVLGSASPASDSLGTAVVYTGNSDRGYAGASVSAAGDVDGDGHDDFLVGAPGSQRPGAPPIRPSILQFTENGV